MTQPFHAHVYFDAAELPRAQALQAALVALMQQTADPQRLSYVGALRQQPVGPHPLPQFEVHFSEDFLPEVLPAIKASGLRTLVHPLTLDDLADHTTLAQWIGEPLALDLRVLDPPGANQGLARFGKTDL